MKNINLLVCKRKFSWRLRISCKIRDGCSVDDADYVKVPIFLDIVDDFPDFSSIFLVKSQLLHGLYPPLKRNIFHALLSIKFFDVSDHIDKSHHHWNG